MEGMHKAKFTAKLGKQKIRRVVCIFRKKIVLLISKNLLQKTFFELHVAL
jgi:hypothetical protein